MGRADIGTASTNYVSTPTITVPVAFTDDSIIVVTPDIAPNGVITVGTVIGMSTGGRTFQIRYRTITGTATGRTLKWAYLRNN